MKHNYLTLFISVFVLSTLGAMAQQATVTSMKYYGNTDFGKFYLRLGVNIPQGAFGKSFDTSIPLNENIGKDGGIGAGLGANFELGRYYFFHDEPIGGILKVGLDATFLSLGYNGGKSAPHPDEESSPFDFVTAAVKFGPVASVNVTGDLFADVFFKLAPTAMISFNAPYHFKGGLYSPGSEVLYFDNEEEVGFALRTDVGVNLRYRKVTLTASYESGNFNVPVVYYHNDGSGDIYETEPLEFDAKMPMGRLQLKLGLQLF